MRFEVVVFEPFERRGKCGETVRLKFTLKHPYRGPLLVVIAPDGAASYVPPDKSAGRDYEIPFRLDTRGGNHRVTLTAEGNGGPEFAARFLIKAVGADGKEIDRDTDVPPPGAVYPSMDPEEDPLRLERILYHRMNDLRATQGLPTLPWHEGVARSARALLPALVRHWEGTRNPATGKGLLLHSIPGTGANGGPGPTIAEFVRRDLGWPRSLPYIPIAATRRGKDQPNYVSESLLYPHHSLDGMFEQEMARSSDHRAPMLDAFLTHAAGAACWRYYGWKADTGSGPPPDTSKPPAPPPPGTAREAAAALVYVQANDPVTGEIAERERRAVLRALAAAAKPEEKADALRLVGRHAWPDSPARLQEGLKSKDPVVFAGALDGLWLCAPPAARQASEPLEIRAHAAVADKEESRALEPLRVLPLVRYDAATRRRARILQEEITRRGRVALVAAENLVRAGKREEARDAYLAAAKRFAGFPAGDDAALAVASLEPPPAPAPRK